MSQSHEKAITRQTAEAIPMHARVVLNGSDKLRMADVEDDIGTVDERYVAADEWASCKLRGDRTVIMIADGSITAEADVYPAADGKVTATVQGRRRGKALTGASAGEYVEVLELPNDALNSIAGANALTGATMNITAAMCKGGHVTTSHSTTATVNLPAGFAGARVTITKIDSNAAAHTMTPNGSEKIQGGANFAAMDAQFDSVTLEWLGGTVGWNIVGKHIA